MRGARSHSPQNAMCAGVRGYAQHRSDRTVCSMRQPGRTAAQATSCLPLAPSAIMGQASEERQTWQCQPQPFAARLSDRTFAVFTTVAGRSYQGVKVYFGVFPIVSTHALAPPSQNGVRRCCNGMQGRPPHHPASRRTVRCSRGPPSVAGRIHQHYNQAAYSVQICFMPDLKHA